METIGTLWLYLVFFAIVAVMLVIDFVGFKHQHGQEVKVRTAAYWSIAWVSVATLFGGGLWLYLEQTAGAAIANTKVMEYFAGYLLEKSLAIDNVFVWLMIFAAFAIPPAQQRKLLLYGVLGAIVLRTIFIFIGAWFVQEFSWILYVFGAFLVYTGFKFLRGQHEEDSNIEDMAILKWLRKHMRITPQLQGDKFFVRQNGLLWATPLFLVLILVEASDVIFAVDSIPAIFAVTTDPFIVLTANLMAILGLRAMFFLLSGAASKMHYLPYGLGLILVFIGFKMLMLDVFHMPIWISLSFIVIVLTVTAILSIRHSKKYNETTL
ncbi:MULTISPECIES: TerC family protein [Acinetobacter]|jgi:tellurite resistance protein TerC|uniref:TerC family protein n=1 Tax=Acinetobacter TaxID=469 RepID=UPI0006621205|nr:MULTISPECIES: TerC family protein [Acinetobacter]KMV01160.1 membrane protein [Acinetobacter sp. VT 511]MBB4836312.1 tellurite resistance protein TerC [Acinetobacter schindleri]MCU4324405.1 TerC family protein [Acinetobacter schindleri]MDP1445822.1 TerC family protein [Acinetobacter schindleri]PUR00746.1 TerC family protein [Acinetobacter schindleri]